MLENVEILERDWRLEDWREERELNVAQITRVTESHSHILYYFINIPKLKRKKNIKNIKIKN